ncbi:imelysin family protein [Myxococcus sp. K38C18041901]|uniref:imelysin family protein n=1 Tax=Myxococcus guangdongensis TaxID=2906760 RepID=UPI0020A6F787|nr:imelysin family protein [Myxococcus guangdongensis]MCP3057473.1 imelysin family protein [Myxococcus guangdongensis]
MSFPFVPPSGARSTRALLLITALATLGGCKESDRGKDDAGPGGPGPDTSRGALLKATGVCVERTAREFHTTSTALSQAVTAWAAQPDATSLAQAKTAYHAAMDSWQVAEVMQVGPAAPRGAAGGAELRDNIYSWPLVSRCAIEEQIVSKGYEAPGFPTSLVSRRGLYALEYLMFYAGEDTACQGTSPIVAQGTWAALSTEERASRKRAYAAVVAREVDLKAAQLVKAWAADQDNFSNTLATAGSGNTVFPTSQAALNSISDAMFYFEREGKDLKLARPLGMRECSTDTCPEHLESQFAHRSKANLRANLKGFRLLAEGCDENYTGTGFDDVLKAAGAEALAQKMVDRIVAAEAAFPAIEEEDLHQALAQDKASVRALHDAFKGVTDVLKTELVTVLDLELPQSVEGDND